MAIGRGPSVAAAGTEALLIGSFGRVALPVGAGLVAVVLVALAVLDRSADPVVALPPPRFVNEAAAAGIDHRYDGEFIHFVGGGVAVLDCDADGRPDLYLAGGAEPAGLYRNTSTVGGALTFSELSDGATDLTAVTGAYPIDVDGDGVLDLVVLRAGENVLLRGTGDCRFERANEAWGINGVDAWTTAFSATWEDDAGLPTLAFGNYLALDEEQEPTDECDRSELVRPRDDGDGYGPSTALEPGRCALSILFSAWSGSGERDLRISNDRHYSRDAEEQLWRIREGEPPTLWTADDGWRTLRIWGMGIASRDLTGDGAPEIYLTSQGDNKLQTLVSGADGPTYEDIALRRGATAHRPYEGDTTMPSTAWHPEFADVNNDGFVDLYVSKGNVEAMTEYAARDPSNLLIGQADGSFVEGAPDAGLTTFSRARGAALADLNLDGLLDLVVVNRREPVGLWRNLGPGGAESDPDASAAHWLAVRAEQPGANRDAVGAWVDVRSGDRTWRVERMVGGGHASGQLGWIHLGLGSAERAEVRVTWPDGEIGAWQSVEADGWFIIDRESNEPRQWMPDQEPNE